MVETAPLPDYPRAANGRRDWSRAAVHGQVPVPSRDTLPDLGSEGFATLIDIINPLQHIPVVGSLYRAATGDGISAPGRIFGGLLFGGPFGFLLGVGSTLMADLGSSASGSVSSQAAQAYTRKAGQSFRSAPGLKV